MVTFLFITWNVKVKLKKNVKLIHNFLKFKFRMIKLKAWLKMKFNYAFFAPNQCFLKKILSVVIFFRAQTHKISVCKGKKESTP